MSHCAGWLRIWLALPALLLAGIIVVRAEELPGEFRPPDKSSSSPPEPHEGNPFLPPGTADRGWPFVRGPTYDEHSPEVNLADSWPSGGPPVLWVRDLGQGYSSFVAAQNRVYTQYQHTTDDRQGCCS